MKYKKHLFYIILIIVFAFFFVKSYKYLDYGRSIKKQMVDNFEKKKRFMLKIYFSGEIIDKNNIHNYYYCVIKIDSINKKNIKFNNITFMPYYSFSNDLDTLTLKVNSNAFNNINYKSKIEKKMNSLNIFIDNKTFPIFDN